jgi:hypothetical protein
VECEESLSIEGRLSVEGIFQKCENIFLLIYLYFIQLIHLGNPKKHNKIKI